MKQTMKQRCCSPPIRVKLSIGCVVASLFLVSHFDSAFSIYLVRNCIVFETNRYFRTSLIWIISVKCPFFLPLTVACSSWNLSKCGLQEKEKNHSHLLNGLRTNLPAKKLWVGLAKKKNHLTQPTFFIHFINIFVEPVWQFLKEFVPFLFIYFGRKRTATNW